MQRDKGRKAEAEVRRIYEGFGFQVRGLEGLGDHLAVGHGFVIHSEVKRQEVLRLPLWARQAYHEAPAGSVPVIAFRKSREQWSALVEVGHVGHLLDAAGYRAGTHYTPLGAAGTWWVRLPLRYLLGVLSGAENPASAQEAL